MSLNPQGIISAVIIVIYIPILILAIRLVTRYGLRESGWLSLVVFSSIRVVGGALLIAAELVKPAVTGLYIGGFALEASGLSPLLLSTLGLLEIIFQGTGKERKHRHVFLLLHVLGLLPLALTILGITNTGGASVANTERRAGVLLFVALYIILIGITTMLWARRNRLMRHRKQLLVAVSAALPFLAVRVLYSVLSMFSSSTFITTTVTDSSTTDNKALAKFNLLTGEWQIYLVMEVIMEFVIAAIYTISGNMLHLDQDYRLQEMQETDQYPIYNQ